VRIVGATRAKVRISIAADSPALQSSQTCRKCKATKSSCRRSCSIDRAGSLCEPTDSAAPLALDGKGQIVAIADTGIDDHASGLLRALRRQVALGRPGRTDDPMDTERMSRVDPGRWCRLPGSAEGVAPKAQIYFQSLLDAQTASAAFRSTWPSCSSLPYLAGARIHNEAGQHDPVHLHMNSIEVDEYVHQRRDMLIVVAAGNEGQAAPAPQYGRRIVDWLSIGAPATAKNALTVGASRSDRGAGGYSKYTWSQQWGSDSGPAIATERISGNPEALAGDSAAAGLGTTGAIKPDLVAPGTDIVSTKSHAAPIDNFWGPHPNARYAYMGGTSMATPWWPDAPRWYGSISATERGPRTVSGADQGDNGQRGALLKATTPMRATRPRGVSPCQLRPGFGAAILVAVIPRSPAWPKFGTGVRR